MPISLNYSKFARLKIVNVLTASTIDELESHLAKLDISTGLALVPTMGALHKGHMSLVQQAVNENSVTVVSIFVNPTQFDNSKDLEKYPRQLEADIEFLKTVFDDLVIFSPEAKELYPEGHKSQSYDFGVLENVMEGEFRDGHFDGVGTIVEKLLTIIKPNKAYFGEKDFQQLQIIRKLVEIKKIPVKIIGCPIVREKNGLAMSSRNGRLSKSMMNEASFIYKTLKALKKKFGTESANKVLKWGEKQFAEHPNLELEYLKIAETRTLRSVTRKRPKVKYRVFAAVYAEGVRLIDNMALN